MGEQHSGVGMKLFKDNELAKWVLDHVELRMQPLRVRWTFDDLVTSDGYDLRCAFECSIRALPEESERRMLQEVLLDGRKVLTSEHIADHFQPAMQTAAANAVRGITVAQGLIDDGRNAIIDALKSAALPVAFSSGVEVVAPFHLDLESPSFQQERLSEMQRGLAERHAAGQVEHFQRAADLLKQFQSIRQSAPELSAGQVLEQISPTDRGSVLQTLLLASADQDRKTALWAVAGSYLVKIDVRESPPKTELICLPATLGPLRSVRQGVVDDQRALLVGARSGFMLVRPESPSEPELYHDPEVTSELGFSHVIFVPQRNAFVGCHGDAGIVQWSPTDRDRPTSAIRADTLRSVYSGANTSRPRNFGPLDGARVLFSLGNKLIGMDASGDTFEIPTGCNADVAATIADDGRILVAYADGTLCAIDRATAQVACRHSAGVKVRTAGALPWLGTTRLLLVTEGGGIQCVGMDDSLVTRYSSPRQGVCVVAGSADVVAAVSDDRQRLVVWNTWNGREPLAEIYLTGLTRHRVADVDFG